MTMAASAWPVGLALGVVVIAGAPVILIVIVALPMRIARRGGL